MIVKIILSLDFEIILDLAREFPFPFVIVTFDTLIRIRIILDLR